MQNFLKEYAEARGHVATAAKMVVDEILEKGLSKESDLKLIEVCLFIMAMLFFFYSVCCTVSQRVEMGPLCQGNRRLATQEVSCKLSTFLSL